MAVFWTEEKGRRPKIEAQNRAYHNIPIDTNHGHTNRSGHST